MSDLENPFAGQGSVLLDIGGDIGALVVVTPADMEGVEVEIRPVGAGEHPDPIGPSEDDRGHDHAHTHDDDGHGHGHDHGHAHHPHVAVVIRPSPNGGAIPSLVYPDLKQGSYELYLKGTYAVEMVCDVRGGEVTEAIWPG